MQQSVSVDLAGQIITYPCTQLTIICCKTLFVIRDASWPLVHSSVVLGQHKVNLRMLAVIRTKNKLSSQVES